METFRTDLNPFQTKSKLSPYFSIIMGILYMFFGVLNYFIHNYSFIDGFIWVLGGIILFIVGYYQKNHSSKYFFELNNNFIRIKDSLKETRTILWTNIKEIHLKPIAIEFHLNNKSSDTLSLDNVGYKNVLDIKENLSEFARNKGIKIN